MFDIVELITSYDIPSSAMGCFYCLLGFFWSCTCCKGTDLLDGIIVRKFDDTGIELWNKKQSDFGLAPTEETKDHPRFTTTNNYIYNRLSFTEIYHDWSGNTYLFGSGEQFWPLDDLPGAGNNPPFDSPSRLIKLDSVGEIVWDIVVRGAIGTTLPKRIAVDDDDNLYILRHEIFFGPFSENYQILKLDSSGSIVLDPLVRQFVGPGNRPTSHMTIQPIDGGTNLVVWTGYLLADDSPIIPHTSGNIISKSYNATTGADDLTWVGSSDTQLRVILSSVMISDGRPGSHLAGGGAAYGFENWWEAIQGTGVLGNGGRRWTVGNGKPDGVGWDAHDVENNDELVTGINPLLHVGGQTNGSIKRFVGGNLKQGLNLGANALDTLVQSAAHASTDFNYLIRRNDSIVGNGYSDMDAQWFPTSEAATNVDYWARIGGRAVKEREKAVEYYTWDGTLVWSAEHVNSTSPPILNSSGQKVWFGATMGVFDSNGCLVIVGPPDFRPIEIF